MRRTALVLLSALAAVPVLAKAPTVHITVDGGNLRTPIDIAAPRILEMSNVWAGQMFDMSRPALPVPPLTAHQYRLSFFADFGKGPEKVYTLLYAPNPRGRGYLYLPWDDRNRGTIMRVGRDGKWSYAAPEWEALIKPVILRSAG